MAEGCGGSSNKIARARRTPFPHRARRRIEPDERNLLLHLKFAIRKGPAKGAHANLRNVLQSISVVAFNLQKIVDVL